MSSACICPTSSMVQTCAMFFTPEPSRLLSARALVLDFVSRENRLQWIPVIPDLISVIAGDVLIKFIQDTLCNGIRLCTACITYHKQELTAAVPGKDVS